MVTFTYFCIMKYKISNTIKQQEYLKACNLNELGYSNKEIIEKTLFPTWRVLEFYMYKNNLKLPFINMPRKHKSNNNFFNELSSFSSAYLLGVTYADGCIYNNHRFGFCLSKQDEELIDYIKKEICPSAIKKEIINIKEARNRQPQIQLRITNYRIVKTLKEKWGVCERKTLNSGLIFPDIEKRYLWNFILGINDGDGCIYYAKNKGLRITICMTDLPFMTKLKDFLLSEGINISLYTKQGKTCKYYLLSTSNNNSALMFCQKIYENSEFYLKRKYNKYQEYCKFKNKDNTELSSTITKGVETV